MKTRNQILTASIAIAASLVSFNVSWAGPEYDFTVDVGSSAAHSLVLSNGESLVLEFKPPLDTLVKSPPQGVPKFQWVKDDHLISGQTNNSLSFPSVAFSNVGTYTLWVNGPKGRQESAPVHLSVYTLFYSNSNGGSLGVPIGQFSSGNNTVCGDTGFDRYKAYFPFYGPNAVNQTAPFQNTSGSTNLDITTCTNVNGTIDSAVRIHENWLPMNEKACNNDDASCAVSTSLCTAMATNLSTNPTVNNTYRATIYYKNSTLGTNKSVTFRWYYHN
jgi:hypothetical protein